MKNNDKLKSKTDVSASKKSKPNKSSNLSKPNKSAKLHGGLGILAIGKFLLGKVFALIRVIFGIHDKVWAFILVCLILLFIIPAIFFTGYVYEKKREASKYDLDDINKLDISSVIYDDSNNEMATISFMNRRVAKIEDMPFELTQTLIAVEDSRFFEHNGVDFIGIFRAMLRNIRNQRISQGASTITQQLARNAYELGGRTFQRKLVEAFLASKIEKKYSKTEILEFYLNRIYFGNGYYGVRTASLGYFGKPVTKLNLSECAALVGLIKNPSNLNPIKDYDACIRARNYALSRMVEEKMLSKNDYAELSKQKLAISPQEASGAQSYALQFIRRRAIDILKQKDVGEREIGVGGYKIFTSLRPNLQSLLEGSLEKEISKVEKMPDFQDETLAEYEKKYRDFNELWRTTIKEDEQRAKAMRQPTPKYLQSAGLIIDNKSGAILAASGGRNFFHSQYDRVFSAKRSPGTAILPFLYTSAYEPFEDENGVKKRKFSPATLVNDQFLDLRHVMIGGVRGILGEWGVELENPRFEGKITAFEALSKGKNSASVRLGLQSGVERFREFCARAGIESDEFKYSNSFLGKNAVKLSDITMAYSIYPQEGNRPKDLFVIKKIVNSDGKTIYQTDENKVVFKVCDPISAYQTHSSLEDSLQNGSASLARAKLKLRPTIHAGVKTGTSYNSTDLCLIGYTNDISIGLWTGFDKPKTIFPNAFSNKILLPAWTSIINSIYQNKKSEPIKMPDSGRLDYICKVSGKRATDYCYQKVGSEDGAVKFQNSSLAVCRPKDSYLLPPCPIHSPEETVQLFDPSSTKLATRAFAGRLKKLAPTILAAPTLIGEDPYHSIISQPNADRDQAIAKRLREQKLIIRNARATDLQASINSEDHSQLPSIDTIKTPEPTNFD